MSDSDPAAAACKLDAYAGRVAAKVATVLETARQLEGPPVVAMPPIFRVRRSPVN